MRVIQVKKLKEAYNALPPASESSARSELLEERAAHVKTIMAVSTPFLPGYIVTAFLMPALSMLPNANHGQGRW